MTPKSIGMTYSLFNPLNILAWWLQFIWNTPLRELVPLYFLPTYIAFAFGARRKWDIAFITIGAGWTGVSWLAGLLDAMGL